MDNYKNPQFLFEIEDDKDKYSNDYSSSHSYDYSGNVSNHPCSDHSDSNHSSHQA
jgi:hypothetical protein